MPAATGALADEKMKVVTTFTVIADMAANVAGEAAEVVSVTKPGAEIHGYEPTPQDIVRASDADLILWNGMNLELWFEQFLTNLDGVPAVTVSEGIDPIPIASGAYDDYTDPVEFAERLYEDAQAINHDGHFRIAAMPPAEPRPETEISRKPPSSSLKVSPPAVQTLA